MTKLLSVLSLLLLPFLGNGAQEERVLRHDLFNNYNKDVRPVVEYQDPVNLYMGMAIQTLESFNQKEEMIKLNVWLRMNWYDDYLHWNSSISNLSFLAINPEQVWTPDVELLNAGAKPEIYTLEGGMMLYQRGEFMWSRPLIFTFSCPLDLHDFPFDTQVCKIRFGSWIFSNQYLNVMPYQEKDKQIDILDSFSHSEWDIVELNLNVMNETRDCCVGESFSILEYTFTLARYSHYYELSMAMTLTLVVVSFIILLMEPSNVSRTSTAVFIPLTILALQLTISDKVPVVGYFTLIDKFFVCCFVTSMVCSIESGIIYSLITTDSSWVYKFFRRFINVERLKQEDKNKDLVNNDNDDNNQSNDNTSNQEELVELQNMNTRSNSYNNAFHRNKNKNNNYSDVIKIANYDDKIINLSYEDRLIYFEIYKYIQFIDNTMRILIPIVFFSYIGHLYSFKN
tara:strand:+ start:995 stop:2356 length:1362 start_codon:yes stop_codon:yes gene_type:complete